MSESATSNGASSMYLARLLNDAVTARLAADGDTSARTGARWLARNAVDPDSGDPVISHQSAGDLLTEPRSGWASRKTMKALSALLFSGDDAIVYTANAVAIGLTPPRTGGGAFAATLPNWLNDLPAAEQAHVRNLIYILGKAHGLTD
jgi:hypothetical protein